MAMRNLLACIASAGGSSDLPCIVLHSPMRDVAHTAARSLITALAPRDSGPPRPIRHVLPAADPGRHSTHFDYERSATSLMIDLSQSEVARCAALDWIAPIAPTKHVLGARRTIVLHCADLLSWAHQNALKKIIESSQCNTLFILTTSQAAALQSAIISRGIVIRCPSTQASTATALTAKAPPSKDQTACITVDSPIALPSSVALPPTPVYPPPLPPLFHADTVHVAIDKALTARCAAAASKACREAGQAVAKQMGDAPPQKLLHMVLNHLLSSSLDDAETWSVVADIALVDAQVAGARGPASKAATLSLALHRALLAACVRRVKITP